MTSALRYEAIVFDLDGTLYRGPTPIAGAVDTVNGLREHVACRFLSNNGERDGATLIERLRGMGFNVDPGDVISSADLVLRAMREYARGTRVLALSSQQLAGALADAGYVLVDDPSAEVVVVGVDRRLTRERLVAGLRAMEKGADLVASNEDPTYPGGDGLRPAAGAYVGFFRGMGYEPSRFCGKPDEGAVRSALDTWELECPERCLFVGDNRKTDIEAARRIGADSVLVLSGVSRNQADKGEASATAAIPTVAELDLAWLSSTHDPRTDASSAVGIQSAQGGRT